ncbi:MAG TPA: hypothetical protein VJR92_01485 [Gemmatimonadaceae bacterium]|nr:hypothetical protein [Gemmatimonadaceae bacterium]
MHDEHNETQLSDAERTMFAALPREGAIDAGQEDHLVDALRAEGYFRKRQSTTRWAFQLAAALALFAGGAYGGARYAERNSLERMLARKDLTVGDRVLLLQRAGSAYIHAANGYADATASIDSAATEVASQVLLGAAQAVARRDMDRGASAWVAAMLKSTSYSPQRMISQ